MREQSPITAGIMELLADGKSYTRAEIVSALSEKIEMDNKKKNTLGALLHYQIQCGRVVKEGNLYRAADSAFAAADQSGEENTPSADASEETAASLNKEPNDKKAAEVPEQVPEKRRPGRPRKTDKDKAAEKETAASEERRQEEKADRRKSDRSGRSALREARNRAREERRAAREARDLNALHSTQNLRQMKEAEEMAAADEKKAREEERTREYLAVTSKLPAVKPNAILELEGCLRRMYLEAEKAAALMRGEIPFADLSDTALKSVLNTYEKILRAKKELE